ncbi:amidohydrolase family protein [Deltaproteobacteria bacterium OttesenSCG-928-M10]|nr:amidohydrolase family protein [Deltaproteobacteria bacterium OttesenSCG-928-M10]
MGNSILLKGGRIMAPDEGFQSEICNVLIVDGVIAEIAPGLKAPAGADEISLEGRFVAPGFIDIHTHIDPDGPLNIGLFPDMAGLMLGNSTIIDAGSTGAGNFEAFRDKYMLTAKSRVFALLNLAHNGIDSWSELAEAGNLRPDALIEAARRNPGRVVGVKVRSDAEAIGQMGLTPFKMGQKAARQLGLPFVAHVGEAPPAMEEMLKLAVGGNLLTHCYTAYAPNGVHNSMINEKGEVLPEVWQAKARGVLFDVGHGGSSFSFKIAHAAFEQGFEPDFIGTDIYTWNYFRPVGSLARTMTKLMHLGLSPEECVRRVTAVPADYFNLKGLGHLRPGALGDLTIFSAEG